MPVLNRVAELHDEVTGWRREIHSNPELLYDVHETAAMVAEKLKSFGVDEIVTGIGETGLVGIINGNKTDSGKVIGLRADMDALPIVEATGKEYASKVEGKMHACGHDGHTAMLLGAAKYLCETRNFNGKVAVIFQPAEEGGAGGKAMVDDGMMDQFGIDEVYGMHNMPDLPVGQFAMREGTLLASADFLDITITGKGGHAANLKGVLIRLLLRLLACRPFSLLHRVMLIRSILLWCRLPSLMRGPLITLFRKQLSCQELCVALMRKCVVWRKSGSRKLLKMLPLPMNVRQR